MKRIVIAFSVMISLNAFAQNENIYGLWEVKKVNVGQEEMTPNAKWSRFNADGTYQSGNGWMQHSIGTWRLDEESSQLEVVSTNGIVDRFGPFKVLIQSEKMTWERMEEGSLVTVHLARIEELPLTYRDKMLGLWKLEQSEGKGPIFKSDQVDQDYLFVRWDGKYVMGIEGGKRYGVYNVHAHKSEIELIPYGDKLERSFWSLEFNNEGIKLTLLNSSEEVTREFIKIRQFPY